MSNHHTSKPCASAFNAFKKAVIDDHECREWPSEAREILKSAEAGLFAAISSSIKMAREVATKSIRTELNDTRNALTKELRQSIQSEEKMIREQEEAAAVSAGKTETIDRLRRINQGLHSSIVDLRQKLEAEQERTASTVYELKSISRFLNMMLDGDADKHGGYSVAAVRSACKDQQRSLDLTLAPYLENENS